MAAVAAWILAGLRPSQLPAEAARAGWDVGTAELLELQQAAREQLEADAKVDARTQRAVAVGRLNFLYGRACSIQDYKAAVQIQRELNRLVDQLDNPFAADQAGAE